MSQMNEGNDDYVFQQDGCLAHFHNDVLDYLNTNLPQCWIECFGQVDVALMQWPSRSPDLTRCDFFLVGICQGLFFVPPVPANI